MNYSTPILKLSAALFHGAGQRSMRKSAGGQTFAADFANGARLAASFRRCRLFHSRFPMSFLSLFHRYRWRASAHTVRSSFFFFRALVSIVSSCASASEIFIPAAAEQSFRHVPPLEDRSISLRALSTGVLQY